MTEPLVYLNGQFVPGPPAIPAGDAGFVFGATVTDRVRTFRGQLFRLDDHLARFRESCHLCRVPLPVSDEELRAAAGRLVSSPHPPGDPLRGYPAPTRGEGEEEVLDSSPPSPLVGEGGRGGEGKPTSTPDLALILLATPGPLDTGPPTVMMHTFPLPFARYRKLFTEGATLVVPPTQPIPAECIDPRAKVRSRMHWWIAEQQAKEIDPDASALLVDVYSRVTETAAANFLIVKDGTVLTPPRDTVLPGVSLRVVEELCGELGIPFAERPLRLAECQSADEAMLTCTSYCVAGVRRLGSVELPWPGPVWRRLLAAWSARVGVDIAAQILQS
ncbi:MAG TPA: aminotransferase class IV [Gemmataceae bacterium]|jgi:branched-subunit amino acid aminotransferase/4-amino-4-deoxychorismate lyase